MSMRFGVAVSRTTVTAMLIRQSRICWRAKGDVNGGETHGDVLLRLLKTAPLPRGIRPRATVVAGLAFSQLKRISGLPSAPAATLARIVRENPSSFFLTGREPLLVTDVDCRSDGVVWVAAFDGAVVSPVVEALSRRGITKVTVIPYAVAIAALLPAGVHALVEDGIGVEITSIEGGRIAVMGRTASPAADSAGAVELAGFLGEAAPSYSAAFAAARFTAQTLLSWRATPGERRTRTRRRLGLTVAVTVFALSSTATIFAPAGRASREARVAKQALGTFGSESDSGTRVQTELRAVSADLDRLARFEKERGGIIALLGAISEQLPESSAVVSLHLDEAEGSFVVLAPHASDVMQQFSEIRGVFAPRIVGSMTRELHGNARLERVSIRFRRRVGR